MNNTKQTSPKMTNLQRLAADELIAFYRDTKYPLNKAEIFDLYERILQSRSASSIFRNS